MALIRLRVCAGWSEPLLVAHTTLLEISCHGSVMILLPSADLTKIYFENSFRNTTRVSNRLDQDQDRPNLGPNCLQMLLSDNKVAASKESKC